MKEFCASCGKPAKKGGLCAACYMVKWRRKKKGEANAMEVGELITATFDEQLKEALIPIFTTQTDEPITKWTEREIYLPEGEGFFSVAHPDWSLAPEMDFIFEHLKNPDVKEIYLMFGSQSSKTLFQFCAMAWFISVKKVNGLFVPPSERLIDRISARMEAIFERSPVLGYEPKKGGRNAFKFGANRINIGLATSPDSLAEMPADFVDFDEIDEIKPQDINPVNLARSRGRTKPNFKLILASTPKLLEGQGGINDYYNGAKRYVIHMQCPHCHEWSEFEESHIQAPEGADHRRIEAESLGYAVCPRNGCMIDDEHHEAMVMGQKWVTLDEELPSTYVGFHKASWNTIHNDWSSIAAKRIKTKEEGPNSYKDFFNSECARPVDLTALGGTIEASSLALDFYKKGEIPGDVKSITIGVDVGVEKVYAVVIGWGAYKKMYQLYERVIYWDNRDFAKVEHSVLNLVHEVNFEFKFLGEGIRPYFVGGAMDSGYRANLIYDFCRKNPLWIPVKGRHPLERPWIINPADPKMRFGSQAKGVNLYTIQSYYWQDVFQTALDKEADKAGSFNLPSDYSQRYLDHLNGEVKKLKVDERKGLQVEVWEKKTKHSQNDFRDATIYAMVRGYTLEIDKLQDAQLSVKAEPQKVVRSLPKYEGRRNNIRKNYRR